MLDYIKQLSEIIPNSSTWIEILNKLNLSNHSQNLNYIKKRCIELNIDFSHVNEERKQSEVLTLDEILVDNKVLTLSGNNLKEKLYKAGLKKRECEECGQGEIWRGKKMSLILDHADGNRKNNTRENLRILCPNCNSTTTTLGGKNKKKSNLPLWLDMINNSGIDITKPGYKQRLVDKFGHNLEFWRQKIQQLKAKGYCKNAVIDYISLKSNAANL